MQQTLCLVKLVSTVCENLIFHLFHPPLEVKNESFVLIFNVKKIMLKFEHF